MSRVGSNRNRCRERMERMHSNSSRKHRYRCHGVANHKALHYAPAGKGQVRWP